jgi:hypothetical protein
MLGSAPLLKRCGATLEPRPAGELQLIFDAAYGPHSGVDAESRLSGLRSVARALGERNMARATMTSLFLRLPEFSPAGLARVAEIDDLIKLHYESRRTGHPVGSGDHYNEDEPRDWHGRWTDGGGTSSNVIPVQGVIPLPLPPPITVPGGSPGSADDDFVYPPSANDNAGVRAKTTATDNKPRVCPDSSFEPSSVGRTADQLLYQAQINGLPLGYHVMLNGLGYDGCRDIGDDSVMLEGKHNTSDWFANMPDDVKRKTNEYRDIMNQAISQNFFSGGRKVEWHLSNASLVPFWSSEFKREGLNNIEVIYTPFDENFVAPVLKLFLLSFSAVG